MVFMMTLIAPNFHVCCRTTLIQRIKYVTSGIDDEQGWLETCEEMHEYYNAVVHTAT